MSLPEGTRHLTWENFNRLIERRIPAVHRVAGSPVIDIFVDERGSRIGLRTPYDDAVELQPSPVAAIALSPIQLGGKPFIEVSTTEAELYPEFYSFATSLADRIQLQGEPAIGALEKSLLNWRQLLQAVNLLSFEKQIGLVGELWLLERLVRHLGPRGLDGWTGPLGEPHDFRLETNEFEVKTTTSATRTHMISGEDQLVPSLGHQLFVVSIQIEPAGLGGAALPELAKRVTDLLKQFPLLLQRFREDLGRVGYADDESVHYGERWQLRNRPRLVRVDASCPQLTRASLAALDPSNSRRISDLHYRVNLEGLGYADDSDEFRAVLPFPGGGDNAAL